MGFVFNLSSIVIPPSVTARYFNQNCHTPKSDCNRCKHSCKHGLSDFRCAQCFQPFPEGTFYEFEGRKYCEHDFRVLFAPSCGKCGKLHVYVCVCLLLIVFIVCVCVCEYVWEWLFVTCLSDLVLYCWGGGGVPSVYWLNYNNYIHRK